MATPLYKIVARLHRTNGVPADDVINVLHFEGDEQGTLDEQRWEELRGGLVDRVRQFYVDITPRMSSVLNGTVTIAAINMRDERPVYARTEETFTLPGRGSSAALPSEVALVLSMEGRKEAGAVMRRRRGRIYLGPWSASAMAGAEGGGDARPEPFLMTEVLEAAATMARGADNAGTARLAVFSPTTAGPLNTTEDDAWNDVVRLWVDDAWDTQRRRGAEATRRDTLDLP